ncbi:hypothetical protein BJ878DRAFT_491944 [Calycina marina]|uniref:Uncharacterized protein n=1 Tax=Calycina marina TaxID=1763456 RepID=A0A9P8CI89_9HELO|nr:hypothetical protein BJ878DRAFT_491944 [Calycina marina]
MYCCRDWDNDVGHLYAVVMEVLDQFHLGELGELKSPEAFYHLSLLNTAGITTGKVSFQLKMRRVI